MATHLKGVFVFCLLLLILMEETKPVLAQGKKLSKRVEKLEENKEKVEERLKDLEKCQACTKIQELNDTINELKEKFNCKPVPSVAGLEDSEILKKDSRYIKALGNFLKTVVQSDSYWKRCWQASKDGWAAKTFHSLCDDKGPTVTIVRVDHKYIFGGYTSLSWKETSWTCGWFIDTHYDSSAFLYSLVNYPAGWQPVKMNLTGLYSQARYSIFTCSHYGPTFGGGRDLKIADNAASNTDSYSELGYTYNPPAGYSYQSSSARSFLAGSYYFQPDEVEVFYKTT